MNRWIRFCGLLVITIFLPAHLRSQVDTAFIHYLQTEELRSEHETYLQKLVLPPDSLHYFKAQLYLQYHEDSLFFVHFAPAAQLFQSDTLTLNFASHYFLTHSQRRFRDSWFTAIDSLQLQGLAACYQWHYRLSCTPDKHAVSLLPSVLAEDYRLLLKTSRKRPWIASCAALIPGMGQLYLGKYRSFIVEFVSLTLTAFQTAESAVNTRIVHPLTILNAGFFTAFYTSGIVGAWRDTQQMNEDAKTHYLLQVAAYYRNRVPSRLY